MRRYLKYCFVKFVVGCSLLVVRGWCLVPGAWPEPIVPVYCLLSQILYPGSLPHTSYLIPHTSPHPKIITIAQGGGKLSEGLLALLPLTAPVQAHQT